MRSAVKVILKVLSMQTFKQIENKISLECTKANFLFMHTHKGAIGLDFVRPTLLKRSYLAIFFVEMNTKSFVDVIYCCHVDEQTDISILLTWCNRHLQIKNDRLNHK